MNKVAVRAGSTWRRWLGVLCLLLWGADEAAAQRRGLGQRPIVELGLRGGYDYRDDRWTAGGQVRWSWERGIRLMLIPNGDYFFGRGDDHWQVNADFVLSPGPLYAGLGRAYTNRIRADGEAEWGTNVFIGAALPLYRFPLRVRVEGRWTYIERRDPFQLVVSFSKGFGSRRRGWGLDL